MDQLATVAIVAAEVPTFPSLSVATAVIETLPFAILAVSHCTVYGEVVAVPINVLVLAKN